MTPKSAETKFGSFTEKIIKSGGKILKTESWGLRSLAYKINKNSKGYYYLITSLDAHTVDLEAFKVIF